MIEVNYSVEISFGDYRTYKKTLNLDKFDYKGISYNSGSINISVYYGYDFFDMGSDNSFYLKNSFEQREKLCLEDLKSLENEFLDLYPVDIYSENFEAYLYYDCYCDSKGCKCSCDDNGRYWAVAYFEYQVRYNLKNSCCDMSSSLQKIKELLI